MFRIILLSDEIFVGTYVPSPIGTRVSDSGFLLRDFIDSIAAVASLNTPRNVFSL